MKNFFFLLLLPSALLTLTACNDIGDPCEASDQQQIIQNYLDENNITAERSETGLFYVIEEEGERVRPDENSSVDVIYTGKLLDGTIFDSSQGQPITFRVDGVVDGFSEGLQLLRKGGKATLYIPCNLGYGNRRLTGIPPGSTLLFEIELVDVR